MKFTLRKAFLLLPLSPSVMADRATSRREGRAVPLPPEKACHEKMVREQSGQEADRFQIRCQCVRDDDSNMEEAAWTLSCRFGCEACFQDECAFMSIDYRFVTSPPPLFLGQSNCFRNREGDEFCYIMENYFGHWATINGKRCLYAGHCPGDDEDSPLFRILCSNLGDQYAVDTCKKSEIAKLEKGPFHFFAYMFGGTADEEPTVGACAKFVVPPTPNLSET